MNSVPNSSGQPISEESKKIIIQKYINDLFNIQRAILRNVYPSPDGDAEFEKNLSVLKASLTVDDIVPELFNPIK